MFSLTIWLDGVATPLVLRFRDNNHANDALNTIFYPATGERGRVTLQDHFGAALSFETSSVVACFTVDESARADGDVESALIQHAAQQKAAQRARAGSPNGGLMLPPNQMPGWGH